MEHVKRPAFRSNFGTYMKAQSMVRIKICANSMFVTFILNSISPDLPRTNNVAEGWHNAFASMTGVKRPSIFRFVDELKKDEDISRSKIILCQAGEAPPPQKPKVIQRNSALKKAVLNYQEQVEAEKLKQAEEANKTDESDDEDMNHGEKNANTWQRNDNPHDKWLNSPEYVLLKAVAHNSRL